MLLFRNMLTDTTVDSNHTENDPIILYSIPGG